MLGVETNNFSQAVDVTKLDALGEKIYQAAIQIDEELNARDPHRLRKETDQAVRMLKKIFGAEAKPEAMLALESIYISLLVNIWTSFEVLATDLWIAATNARPKTLGDIALKSPKIREHGSPLNPMDGKQKDDLTSISIDTLARYGYDIKNKIGTIVYEAQKFSFNRLANIHSVYKINFKDEADTLFKQHDQVRILEAVRNVLTHRAGIIDQTFKDRVAQDQRLSAKGLEIKQKLDLSGSDVAHYVNSTIRCGNDLLGFVDSWLLTHPD